MDFLHFTDFLPVFPCLAVRQPFQMAQAAYPCIIGFLYACQFCPAQKFILRGFYGMGFFPTLPFCISLKAFLPDSLPYPVLRIIFSHRFAPAEPLHPLRPDRQIFILPDVIALFRHKAKKLLKGFRLHDAGIHIPLYHFPPDEFSIPELIPVLIPLIAFPAVFLYLYGGKPIFLTKPVCDGLYPFCPVSFFITVFPAVQVIHAVEYDMPVDMGGIVMDSEDRLVLLPQIFLHKPPDNLKSSVRTDLTRLKGNDEVVALSLTRLPILLFCLRHLFIGFLRQAVDSRHQPAALRFPPVKDVGNRLLQMFPRRLQAAVIDG